MCCIANLINVACFLCSVCLVPFLYTQTSAIKLGGCRCAASPSAAIRFFSFFFGAAAAPCWSRSLGALALHAQIVLAHTAGGTTCASALAHGSQ